MSNMDERITFKIGDYVTATMNTRTLTEGMTYLIFERNEVEFPDGTYYVYTVIDDKGNHLTVNNGHLLFKWAH